MIGKILSKLFGYKEKPYYPRVKTLASPKKKEIPPELDVEKMLGILKEKHLVDSITVFTKEGTLIATTLDQDLTKEYAIFEHVRSELDATHVFIKKDEWTLIFITGNYVFIVHAPYYINTIELSILARDIEKMLFGMGW